MSKQNEFYCLGCNTTHKKSSFYVSYNSMHSNGIMPYCKKFIKKEVVNKDKTINLDKLKSLLMQMDAPFLADYWQKSVDDEKETIGMYFKNLSLKQNRGLKWKDSVFDLNDSEDKKNDNSDTGLNDDSEIKLSQSEISQLKETWGGDWKPEELLLLDKTYKELSADKNMKYNSSKQYMKLAVMNYVRSYMAMRSGNAAEAEKYTKLFNETMKMGEFNPSALAKNSNLEKLGSFSDFSLMVEECVDIVDLQKILPEYMQQPRDLPDKVIWYVVNYMQDSLGYKRSGYKDIYKFYSQMEADFYGVPLGSIPKSSTVNDFLDNTDEK